MSKKYELPKDNTSMVSEPVAAYALQQESTNMFMSMVVHKEKNVASFAKRACTNDENFMYHKQHGFYEEGIEGEVFESEQQLVEALDKADAEGYITDDETNHLMNLWKIVS